MNDKAKIFLAFIAGAGTGAFVAWKMLEKKYKQIADDEIASVKDVYNRKLQKKAEEEKSVNKENYGVVVDTLGYNKESKEKEEERDMVEDAKVYVIPPENFGETGLDTVSLTYYADKVLAYDLDNKVIKNVDEIVGRNSLETFGEYEDDSVFVRNENLNTDFEILLDMRKYSDVVTKKPHLVDDDDEN